ncbi:hypothetical protein C8R46DRAFT_1305220 [Mycena filopes]|nr:hypothetical protein C8R46DRAFT_1305220 [Mycena filopes]
MICFPLELEREIFETAALQDLDTIPTLLLVSRRVKTWVEPLLYRIVQIPTRFAPILSAIRVKPSSFLQMAVHHLFIPSQMTDAANIILSCSGIHSLFVDGTLDAKLLDVLDPLHVQRLNFTLSSSVAPAPLTRSTFLRLTHLELYRDPNTTETSVYLSWQYWSPLAFLPALTHLCLSEPQSALILSDVGAECAQLVVIVTACWDLPAGTERAHRFAQTLTLTDPRVVVMAIESYTDDWVLGAEGREDFWVRAENFVVRKRKGGIPETTFFLDDN